MSSVRSIARIWSRAAFPRKVDPAARRVARAALLPAVVASLAAGLAGCASEAKLLRVEPSFTAAALSAGGLAVVGVVKKEEVEQVRPPLIAALTEELGRARPDLRLVDADRVTGLLGLPAYRRVLQSYQARGWLDSAEVRSLAGALGGEARFAVLGRVTSDGIRTSERDLAPEDSSRYRFFNTLLVTGRDARVDVQVYDLASGSMVYRGQFAGSAEDSRPARYRLDAGAAGSGTAIGVGLRETAPTGAADSAADSWGRYPPAPALASALTEAFRAFASGLPR